MFIDIYSKEDDNIVYLNINEIKTIRWDSKNEHSIIEFGQKQYDTNHLMYFYSYYFTPLKPYELIVKINNSNNNLLSILNKEERSKHEK